MKLRLATILHVSPFAPSLVGKFSHPENCTCGLLACRKLSTGWWTSLGAQAGSNINHIYKVYEIPYFQGPSVSCLFDAHFFVQNVNHL